MKNNGLYKLFLLVTLMVILITGCSSKTPYEKAIESFTPISLEEVQKNIDNGTPFILYMGSSSCSFCTEVAPHVQQAAKREGATIYYMNTDAEELQDNQDFEKFRNDHDIEFDPAMILFTQDGFEKTSLMTDTDQTALIFKKYLKKVNGQ